MTDLLDYASEFRFKLYPEGHEFWDVADLDVLVAWRSTDRWAVIHNGFCYDVDGYREYESIPSDRQDEFRSRYRFDRDEAVRIAREVVVPKLRAIWDQRLARKQATA